MYCSLELVLSIHLWYYLLPCVIGLHFITFKVSKGILYSITWKDYWLISIYISNNDNRPLHTRQYPLFRRTLACKGQEFPLMRSEAKSLQQKWVAFHGYYVSKMQLFKKYKLTVFLQTFEPPSAVFNRSVSLFQFQSGNKPEYWNSLLNFTE